MMSSKERNLDLIDLVKSWFSSRSEPANVSRSFWMPDDSCVVCYECDSQFTVINRRHHCRKCGRVFCARCTSNSIPAELNDPNRFREDGERVRVCNFCFRQWQESIVVNDNGLALPSPDGSSSVSVAGLNSPRVSSTPNKKDLSSSFPCMNGVTEHVLYGSAPSLGQHVQLEPERKCDAEVATDMGHQTIEALDGSLNHYSFCSNRSDDDYDEYEGLHSDSEIQRFSGHDGYSQNDFESHNYHSTTDNDHMDTELPLHDKAQQHTALDVNKMEGSPVDNSEDGNATSSIFFDASTHKEPFEFDNTEEALWHPPGPVVEEDDRESCYFDEEDEGEDDDGLSECRDASSSSSILSSEFKSRDRLGELHKRAMKSIIGGHFRALVAQLLQVENIPTGDGNENENWLDIITYLSWEAASLLKPDTSSGGGMDPGLYVKVKCLAYGRPSDSMLVKGVVCKKNVAHRRMTSKIEKPRVLVLGGSLEYQRVTNTLSCFDTLLQQEMDHLKMAVAKIASHQPSVLLVEKSVSRFAQEYLLGKNISLVLNIKRPLLERIARCTGAEIVPSVDHLSSPKLGHCDLFHVEKFLEHCVAAGQGGKKLLKTLMFFEGCPKPLGYTILLKGASAEVLRKIKHVVQYGVFAAYHLALETSFLADEGATLPELPLKSPITVALPDMPLRINRSITTISDFDTGNDQSGCSLQRSSTSDPNFYLESSNKTQGSALVVPENRNCQSSVFFGIPDPLPSMKGVTTQNGDSVAPLIPLPSTGALTDQSVSSCCIGEVQNVSCFPEENHKCVPQSVPHDLVTPANNFSNTDTLDSDGVRAYDKHIDSTETIDRQPQYSSDSQFVHQVNAQDDHEFSTSSSDHQSILVSLSSRCVWKGIVCERTHLKRIKYYGNFDMPLGRYLRDRLLDQNYKCPCCELSYEAHVCCYTHRQGSLTISVRKIKDDPLVGERDGKIWMWHRCLRCPRVNGLPVATSRVVMSDAAWGLSFGKFLELSFSNHAAASRVANCGHSLHRDCLRFYGCGRMVACFRYAPINVNSVYLPPPVLNFVHQNMKWAEEVKEVTDNSKLLFTEVSNSLCQIAEERANAVCADDIMKVELKKNISQLELILQKEESEFKESLQKARGNGNNNESIIDILEINKLQRKLLFHSYIWDRRLVFVTHSCNITYDMVNGLLTKNKNLTRSLATNNANLEASLLDSKDSNALNDNWPPTEAQDGVCQFEQPNINKQNGLGDDGIWHNTQGKGHISTSKSVDHGIDTLESGHAVRRVLSESHFKTPVDLSDTLDAKWTGESGPAARDDNKLKPVGVPEDANLLLASCVFEEHKGSDTTIITKLEQSTGTWIKLPFSDLYNSFNRNYCNVPRYDAWSDYVPKYIHSFKKLMDQGGRRLLLNLGVNDTVIPVYDDEPTSIIAFALVSPDYRLQVVDKLEKYTDCVESSVQLAKQDSGISPQHDSADKLPLDSFKSFGSLDDSISKSSLVLDPATSAKAKHVKVSFPDDGKVKYTVTCYFAKCFDALRSICCPSELDFIQSISRCKKWGAQGGKSNVFFAKTLDDRFIIKQVTKTELESFIEFAPGYFKYLSDSILTGSPTCLAKILGIYQVTIKHLNSSRETKKDLLVMENLLFARKVRSLYDLKGSTRSRYNADKSGENKVLLDQNLIEAMPTSPIFVGNKAKRLLERAVWNDTAFLASIDVMDYSLLVGIDEDNNELVLGIIDFMRQYTWDKHLETWVKTTGILGGQRNVSPTVISPKQYKIRFRKAMSAYFLVVQDDWAPSPVPISSQSEPS